MSRWIVRGVLLSLVGLTGFVGGAVYNAAPKTYACSEGSGGKRLEITVIDGTTIKCLYAPPYSDDAIGVAPKRKKTKA